MGGTERVTTGAVPVPTAAGDVSVVVGKGAVDFSHAVEVFAKAKWNCVGVRCFDESRLVAEPINVADDPAEPCGIDLVPVSAYSGQPPGIRGCNWSVSCDERRNPGAIECLSSAHPD